MPQNISEFRIIGRVSKIDSRQKVSYVDVGANYNRKQGDDWVQDTHWNQVTCFGRSKEAADKANKGDLVHITGRVRQQSYENNDGERRFTSDLIADSFSILASKGSTEDQGGKHE